MRGNVSALEPRFQGAFDSPLRPAGVSSRLACDRAGSPASPRPGMNDSSFASVREMIPALRPIAERRPTQRTPRSPR